MALLGSRFSLREAQKLNLVVRPIIDDETAFVFQWGRYWTITWSNWHLQDSAFLATHFSCKSFKKKQNRNFTFTMTHSLKEKTKMHQVELSWNWQKVHFLQIQRVIPGILFIRKLLEAPRARRALLPEAESGRQSLDQMHRRHLQPRLAFSTMIYELLNLSGANSTLGRNLPIFWWRERESWAIVQTNPSLMENHHLSLFCWLT